MLLWWMDFCMDVWMDEGVSGWVGEWVDGWWVDGWDRRMARFQIYAIIGYQGGKEPPDSSSSIPHPSSAQMKSGVDVFLCVGDRWMVTGNTGNHECLTRLALDAASSGEFSQIVPPRSHLSVLGTLGSVSPVIGWRSCVYTWPLHYPPSSLRAGPVWELQGAFLLRLSALLYLLRYGFYTCWGVSLLRPITACRFSRKRMSSANVPRTPQHPLWGALDRIVVLEWGPKLFSVLSSLFSWPWEMNWAKMHRVTNAARLDHNLGLWFHLLPTGHHGLWKPFGFEVDSPGVSSAAGQLALPQTSPLSPCFSHLQNGNSEANHVGLQ